MEEEIIQQVLTLLKFGKKQGQIAKELGVSASTIQIIVKKLIQTGRITPEEIKGMETENEEEIQRGKMKLVISTLIQQGLSCDEVAEKLGCSKSTIDEIVQKLAEEGKIQKTNEIIAIQLIMESKQKLESKQLNKAKFEQIRQAIMLVNDYHNIPFFCKVCLYCGKSEEAQRFLNQAIYDEDYTQEQKDKLKQLKIKVDQIIQKAIAKQALSKGLGLEEAMDRSGLLEVEVLAIRRELEGKKMGKMNEGRS